jgi:hypothetical protein
MHKPGMTHGRRDGIPKRDMCIRTRRYRSNTRARLKKHESLSHKTLGFLVIFFSKGASMIHYMESMIRLPEIHGMIAHMIYVLIRVRALPEYPVL